MSIEIVAFNAKIIHLLIKEDRLEAELNAAFDIVNCNAESGTRRE
jgi:hypothetical protein